MKPRLKTRILTKIRSAPAVRCVAPQFPCFIVYKVLEIIWSWRSLNLLLAFCVNCRDISRHVSKLTLDPLGMTRLGKAVEAAIFDEGRGESLKHRIIHSVQEVSKSSVYLDSFDFTANAFPAEVSKRISWHYFSIFRVVSRIVAFFEGGSCYWFNICCFTRSKVVSSYVWIRLFLWDLHTPMTRMAAGLEWSEACGCKELVYAKRRCKGCGISVRICEAAGTMVPKGWWKIMLGKNLDNASSLEWLSVLWFLASP